MIFWSIGSTFLVLSESSKSAFEDLTSRSGFRDSLEVFHRTLVSVSIEKSEEQRDSFKLVEYLHLSFKHVGCKRTNIRMQSVYAKRKIAIRVCAAS